MNILINFFVLSVLFLGELFAAALPAPDPVSPTAPSLFTQFIHAFDYGDPTEAKRIMNAMNFAHSQKRCTPQHLIDRAQQGSADMIALFRELIAPVEPLTNQQYKLLDLMFAVGAYGADYNTYSGLGNIIRNVWATSTEHKAKVPFIKLISSLETPQEVQIALNIPSDLICRMMMHVSGLRNCLYDSLIGDEIIMPNKYDVIGRTLRLINTPDAMYNYALLLTQGRISVDFYGKKLNTPEARYAEAGRLYREANTLSAMCNYAVLLTKGRITFAFDGVTPLNTPEARDAEVGRLYRAANTPDAMCNYAVLLTDGRIFFAFDGKKLLTPEARYAEAGILCRAANTPDAMFCYGLLLTEERISVDFYGKKLNTREAGYIEAGRLYREANTIGAMCNYAVLLTESRIFLAFDGKKLLTPEARYAEAGRLFQLINTPDAMRNYASLLTQDRIFFAFDGKKLLTPEARDAEAERLYRAANTPDAMCSYALLLTEERISLGFDGVTQLNTQQARDAEAGRLYRAANTPSAIYNYGSLLTQGRIFLGFDGVTQLNTREAGYIEAGRLYRAANTLDARYGYGVLLTQGRISVGFDGVTQLNTPEAILAEIEQLLGDYKKDGGDQWRINIILQVAHLKYRPEVEKKDVEDLITSQQDQANNGDETAQDVLNALYQDDSVSNVTSDEALPLGGSSSEDDDPVEDTPVTMTATSPMPAASFSSVDTDVVVASPSNKQQNRDKKAQRTALLVKKKAAQQKRIFESLQGDAGLDKRSRIAGIISTQIKPVSLGHKRYTVNTQRVIIQPEFQTRVDILINAIQNKTNEGNPERLSGKITLDDGKEYALYSRRIDKKNRLIYAYNHDTRTIHIIRCGGHYRDS